MAKNCDGCKNKNYTEEEKMMTIPYIAHQSAAARQERQIRRMWVIVLVLIFALIGTNLAWIIYENSFEDYLITQEVEQDAENGVNNFVGGDVYGETKD